MRSKVHQAIINDGIVNSRRTTYVLQENGLCD